MLTENSIKLYYYRYLVIDKDIYVDIAFIIDILPLKIYQQLLKRPIKNLSVKGNDLFLEIGSLYSFLLENNSSDLFSNTLGKFNKIIEREIS